MDSTTAWESVDDLVEALSNGDAAIGLGAAKPTSAAVLGAKLAMRLLRSEGTSLNPPPAILAMPWGSIVFWWRGYPQRRIEVVSRDEAYEFVDTNDGAQFRRFMSGPPKPGESGRLT
jgi:hypothetical protein